MIRLFFHTILTVNLEELDAIGLPDRAFIDINNNPDAMEFLELNHLATDTGYRSRQRLGGVPDGACQPAACLPALSGIVQSHQYLHAMFPINKPDV